MGGNSLPDNKKSGARGRAPLRSFALRTNQTPVLTVPAMPPSPIPVGEVA